MNTKPVSTVHLVFGVLFLGIAAVKFIGEGTNADLPNSAIGFPIVLIGAGLIGLVATVVNARRRNQPLLTHEVVEESPTALDDDVETTTVIEENR